MTYERFASRITAAASQYFEIAVLTARCAESRKCGDTSACKAIGVASRQNACKRKGLTVANGSLECPAASPICRTGLSPAAKHSGVPSQGSHPFRFSLLLHIE